MCRIELPISVLLLSFLKLLKRFRSKNEHTQIHYCIILLLKLSIKELKEKCYWTIYFTKACLLPDRINYESEKETEDARGAPITLCQTEQA